MTFGSFARYVTAVLLPFTSAQSVSAQSPAEFYKGKTVELYIAYTAGGGYDLYARMVARHIGKHIPGNPQVVAKNMDGAGGLPPAQLLFHAGPPDGPGSRGARPHNAV